MTTNVFTKKDIIKNLASDGYFVDAYTLDSFFEKWKIEAIFEDDDGSEFFDKNVLQLVKNNLFDKQEERMEIKEEFSQNQHQKDNNRDGFIIEDENLEIHDELEIQDDDTTRLLGNISLSDGTPLIEKIRETSAEVAIEEQNKSLENAIEEEIPPMPEAQISPEPRQEITYLSPDDNDEAEFDDISLLSDSLEAQEKFREYVVSEMTKKNLNLTPTVDISDSAMNKIARAMAKKIAKHVNTICSQTAKSAAELADAQELNKRLELRARALEEQNKKLRLLLAESNKNLNSYKPTVFGLYKKVARRKK